MNLDACTLEKAAFACFSNKLEDSFKRLLFLNINKVVSESPNITDNQAFGLVSEVMAVERLDFDAAVRAMKTPFQRISINRYKRKREQCYVQHLNPTDSAGWNEWVRTITENYPELSIWVNR